MEDKLIKEKRVSGVVHAPASKSMTIRAFCAGLLAHGESVIRNASLCDDAIACASLLRCLGASVKICEQEVRIVGTSGLKERVKGHTLHARESALCARMFIPLASLREEEFIITGSGSLLRRPFTMVEDLTKFGATCRTSFGFLPVWVKGPLRGGWARIKGDVTSQFLTGLLFSLPLAPVDSSLYVDSLMSKPYVRMTLQVLSLSGILVGYNDELTQFEIKGRQVFEPFLYTCEGDWSSAAFFLVAAAISGPLQISGLSLESNQADRVILDVLRAYGTKVRIEDSSIFVEPGDPRAFEFDAKEAPDLVPPLFVLAVFSKGKSKIFGIERLKYKESNRIDTLARGFSRLGVKMEVLPDRVEIWGGRIGGGTVQTEGDHRIAMAFAIAGLRSKEGIMIRNADCVKKSYPEFFVELGRISGE